jgi:O-antigen biosynthesis protein
VASRHVGEYKSSGLAPAVSTRFVAHAETIEDWRRVFLALAKHAGADVAIAQPKVTILTPLWNTQPLWLAEAAVSVFDQTSHDWEWCLVDDGSTHASFQPMVDAICAASPRVRFARLPQHGGISAATNLALSMARGEWVCCLDHDDMLHPEALEVCFEFGGFDAVYTDSDKADEAGVCSEPFYKPGWSPEYFRGVMYAGHLLCVRREVALEIGGFDSRYDGVQDFEFLLRYSEKRPKIGHIPRILYHWRKVAGSVAGSTEAKPEIGLLQQRAVAAQLERLHLPAKAMTGKIPHRVSVVPDARSTQPRVSIVVLVRDSPENLGRCLESLFRCSAYPNVQVLCADNATASERSAPLMKRPGVDRVLCPGEFHFSRLNNECARGAEGEFLVFLEESVEVITPDWIAQMLYHAEQPDAGAVGALLVNPSGSVQQCGLALDGRGEAHPVLRGGDAEGDGYAGSMACARECSAVTAACMMIRRQLFLDVGGFSEHLMLADQDIDLCLRLRSAGKRNVCTPRAVLRNYADRADRNDVVDRALLVDSWEDLIEAGDPFFNVNFDCATADYRAGADADRGAAPAHVRLWAPNGKLPMGSA